MIYLVKKILMKAILTKLSTKLTDPSSFKHRYWRIPPSIYGEVRTHLRQLLDIDIIQPPFSSNLVLVKKKNGSLRLCVDYRQRNLQTKPDYYALLCIKELLDSYVQGTSFSQLLIWREDTSKWKFWRSTRRGLPFLFDPLASISSTRCHLDSPSHLLHINI